MCDAAIPRIAVIGMDFAGFGLHTWPDVGHIACAYYRLAAWTAWTFTLHQAQGQSNSVSSDVRATLYCMRPFVCCALHRCLQNSKTKKDFGKLCLAEIIAFEQKSSQDYRFNFRLKKQCKGDIERVCKDVCHFDQDQV